MNTTDKKRTMYITPKIECVKLDSEISLQLESPPKGPDESVGLFGAASAPEYFNNDPFKTNVG